MNGCYERYQYLSYAKMVEDSDSWWIPDYRYNMLFKVSGKNLNVERVVDFEVEQMDSEGACILIVPYQDKLILLPQNSLNVVVYEKNNDRTITLSLETEKKQKHYGTAGYALLGGNIYVFSSYKECIPFVLNIETMNLSYLKTWKKQLERYSTGQKWFINSVCEVHNRIFLGLYNTNIILIFDPQKNCYEKIELPDSSLKINKIYQDISKDKLIILPNNDRGIMEISIENGIFSKTGCWMSKMGESKVVAILFDDEEFVLLPKSGTYIEIINRKSEESWGMDIPEEYLIDSCDSSNKFLYGGKIGKEFICLFPFLTRGLIYINRKTKRHYLTEFKIDRKAILNKVNIKTKKIYNERKMLLSRFLDICETQKISDDKENYQVGTGIFNCLSERIKLI